MSIDGGTAMTVGGNSTPNYPTGNIVNLYDRLDPSAHTVALSQLSGPPEIVGLVVIP